MVIGQRSINQLPVGDIGLCDHGTSAHLRPAQNQAAEASRLNNEYRDERITITDVAKTKIINTDDIIIIFNGHRNLIKSGRCITDGYHINGHGTRDCVSVRSGVVVVILYTEGKAAVRRAAVIGVTDIL